MINLHKIRSKTKVIKIVILDRKTRVKLGQLYGDTNQKVRIQSNGEINIPYFIRFSRATLPFEITFK